MDDKVAGNLSKFMLDLHEEGMGVISKNVFLKKYRFLQESFARASNLGIFFNDSSRHKMQPYLKAYFLEPRGVTPYFRFIAFSRGRRP